MDMSELAREGFLPTNQLSNEGMGEWVVVKLSALTF